MIMEDLKTKMTIFYSKETGEIGAFCTGIQDLNYFGERRVDYEKIYDFVVLVRDDEVMKNTNNYKINLEAKSLEIKPQAVQQNSYPIASS